MHLDVIVISLILIVIISILVTLFDRKKNQSAGSGEKEPKKAFNISEIYSLASKLDSFFNQTAHPKDLLNYDDFVKGARSLANTDVSNEELISYGTGENVLISCIAFEALNERKVEEKYIGQVIDKLKNTYLWPVYFALRVIENSSQPVIGRTLAQTRNWWIEYKVLINIFDEFIQKRVEGGETPGFHGSLEGLSGDDISMISDFINKLDKSLIKNLFDELEELKVTALDTAYLNSVGKVLDFESRADLIVRHPKLLQLVEQFEDTLFREHGKSVLLVGEPGVGKSVAVKLFGERCHEKGWKIFEASATDILAGQSYIGELEARIQKMIKNLDAKRRVIWYIPDFHHMHYAGRHRYSPTSVLDMILPFVESGKVKIIGETHPASNEKLSNDNKRVHSSIEIIRVKSLEDLSTLQLVSDWVVKSNAEKQFVEIKEDTLKEALHLSKQFLNDSESPGNLFNLLKIALRQLQIEGNLPASLSSDDLYAALSKLTGLPRAILDDHEGLDLNNLSEHFRKRVIGQNEAIECLVERVAMIKAGLTDPTRPFGVFLFAGPTGTGKTEIAKALADFLFGSADRMIRLDMSEFKTVESVDRILGDFKDESDSSALVNQIRQQPFSVILLDEFEKAHSNIWDLFLQVFDDGRLTDKRGNAADFRHTIIIMTSNLGATIKIGANLGFTSDKSSFSFQTVENAIARTFRREFMNRIDRIVIFRPLSRSVMRNILYNELSLALQRRGLRTREWAVEWEDSAIDFLLEKGFTTDLGARPLKRAIERYLLSPLALTIVNHTFPSGDQFLFIKSDGKRIQVEFIDPDAPEEEFQDSEEPVISEDDSLDWNLKKIILEPRGTKQELDYLNTTFNDLEMSIENDEWIIAKDALFKKISSAGFWDSSDRFSILSDTEYMDRIESGLKTAKSLINRAVTGNVPKNLISRLAQQLYLLNEAYENVITCNAKDCFVRISTNPVTDAEFENLNLFAGKLKNMYLDWAKLRNMKSVLLDEMVDTENNVYHSVIAFSGFGAYSILNPEHGLHIFEAYQKENRFTKLTVKVQVEAQPEFPANNRNELLSQAIEIFGQRDMDNKIIRHYREQPSPMVKDNIRKWRTGRLDKVLEGNFDLFM